MSLESFLSKLEKENTRTFTLPSLQEEITYKKMDVIESSVNRSLPNFLASRVLDAMKKSVGGKPLDTDPPELNDDDIKDLLIRATEMWKKLVVDPKLNDDQIVQIPSEDRLAWFMYALSESQQSETKGGGVITAEEAATFPEQRGNKRNSKRSTDSEVL